MKYFLPLIIMLVVVAHARGDQKIYHFDEKILDEIYDKLSCQPGADVIRNRLQEDNRRTKEDRNKLSDSYRGTLQKCLTRLAAGEKFDLDNKLRKKLIAKLLAPSTVCRDNEVPLSLDSITAKEWVKQLRLSGSFELRLLSDLDQPLYDASSELKCGERPKGR